MELIASVLSEFVFRKIIFILNNRMLKTVYSLNYSKEQALG